MCWSISEYVNGFDYYYLPFEAVSDEMMMDSGRTGGSLSSISAFYHLHLVVYLFQVQPSSSFMWRFLEELN